MCVVQLITTLIIDHNDYLILIIENMFYTHNIISCIVITPRMRQEKTKIKDSVVRACV